MLEKNQMGPGKFYKKIKQLYKLRGDLVHEAKSEISIEELKEDIKEEMKAEE